MTPHQALHLFGSSKTMWELLLGQVASPISRASLGYRQHWGGHLTSSSGAGQAGSSSGFSVLCFCTMTTHSSPGEVGWRCEGSASVLHCVWWWPGHWLCMTSAITPAPCLKLAIPNCERDQLFTFPHFLNISSRQSVPKHVVAMITALLLNIYSYIESTDTYINALLLAQL